MDIQQTQIAGDEMRRARERVVDISAFRRKDDPVLVAPSGGAALEFKEPVDVKATMELLASTALSQQAQIRRLLERVEKLERRGALSK